jgi:hypothetical protein
MIKEHQAKSQMITLGFTATPKTKLMPRIYRYSREQAVKEGVTAPLVHDSFIENYSDQNIQKLIIHLPNLLRSHLHPSGLALGKLKGIIYFPPGTKLDTIKDSLTNYSCYVVRSSMKNVQAEVKKFSEDEKPCIALAIGMLNVGYNDKDLDWVMLATPPSKDGNRECQNVGRALRSGNNLFKVGYVLTFSDANISKLEISKDMHADRPAYLLIHPTYKMKRHKKISLDQMTSNINTDEKTAISHQETSDSTDQKRVVSRPVDRYPMPSQILYFYERIQTCEQELYNLSLPKKNNRTISFFPKITSPLDSMSLASKREYLTSQIISYKNELIRLGVPEEDFYKLKLKLLR